VAVEPYAVVRPYVTEPVEMAEVVQEILAEVVLRLEEAGPEDMVRDDCPTELVVAD
jgi:hypothetical protein